MVDITKFLERHPKVKYGAFNPVKISQLRGKIPTILVEFLENEGRAIFGGMFRTVLPESYHEILIDWGLPGSDCYVIMTSVFGNLIYFYNDGLYGLNPNTGIYGAFMDSGDPEVDFSVMMNNHLVMDLILNSDFMFPLFEKYQGILRKPNENEVYALRPSIPEGGSPESSEMEVVDLAKHLSILAQLYDNRAIEE